MDAPSKSSVPFLL